MKTEVYKHEAKAIELLMERIRRYFPKISKKQVETVVICDLVYRNGKYYDRECLSPTLSLDGYNWRGYHGHGDTVDVGDLVDVIDYLYE